MVDEEIRKYKPNYDWGSSAIEESLRDKQPYRGWVTDAATGKPIEGAVVVAVWQILRRNYTSNAGASTEAIRLEEVLTDKDGRFEFAALGDYSAPPGWEKEPGSFPMLGFFRPGYEPAFRTPYTWEAERNEINEPLNNPATASLRKPTREREIQLFAYLTRSSPLAKIPEQKSEQGSRGYSGNVPTPERRIEGLLWNFAFFLGGNVVISDPGARGNSQRRRKAVEAQWHAILMVDKEIRKYKPNYDWGSSAIKEALRDKREK